MAQASDGSARSERRLFCLGCIYAMSAVIAGALAIPAVLYLFLPPGSRKGSQWVDAGDLAQVPIKQPEALNFRRTSVDGWKISSEKATAWVVKTANQQVLAFSPWCTHLGCAYHWDDLKKEFLCPCHGSVFDMEGKVVSGPAPRPLDRYETKLEGNRLWLGAVRKSGEARA